MNAVLQDSVFPITSNNRDNHKFGTGFIIHKDETSTYFVTSAHVVEDVGGPEQINVSGDYATVVAIGSEEAVDLAVLRVEKSLKNPPLAVQICEDESSPIISAGFQRYGTQLLVGVNRGRLARSVQLQPKQTVERVPAWDVIFDEGSSLAPGHSGSPVVDEISGYVLGIIISRVGEGKRGLAISIEILKQIWKDMPATLFQTDVPKLMPDEALVTPPKPVKINMRAISDKPSNIDLLGFSIYAQALADFIKNIRTEKPLTIGIDATWGRGKTTLMHMIENELKDSSLTVWFNVWKYDKEESLWAIITLEILSQVQKKLSLWNRLLLWLGLNWKRFDWSALLQSVVKSLVIVFLLVFLGAIIFAFASLWLGATIQESFQRLKDYIGVVGGVGAFLAIIYSTGKEAHKNLAGPFDLKIAQFVRQPNYKEKIGFFGQFEKDFNWVIEVVTQNGKQPLVIFIDDLDRCTPGKSAELMETINLLLDAEFCVFIIGMDSQVVASSIEAKYEYLRDIEGEKSDLTLGRRFLEKIVQINFRIPRVETYMIENFVNAHLDLGNEQSSEQITENDAEENEPVIVSAGISVQVEIDKKQEEFIKSFDDSEEVQKAIQEAAPYLDLNPRKIKRFINVFRLQAFIANRRNLFLTGLLRLELLAKWLVISTRWPNLIEILMNDLGFLDSLLEAYATRKELRTIQTKDAFTSIQRASLESKSEKELEAGLKVFLSDERMEKFINSPDLIGLLQGMTTSEIKTLPYYLHLAQISAEGAKQAIEESK